MYHAGIDLDEMLSSAAKSFKTQSERCCQLGTSCLKKKLLNVVVIEKQKLIVVIRLQSR